MNPAERMTGGSSGGSTARRFLVGQSLGQAADAATAVTLAGALLPGSNGVVDARSLLETLAATTIPYVVVGPVAGVVADRWNRRRTLGWVNVGRAMLTLGAAAAIASGSRSVGLLLAASLLGAARIVYTLRAASLPWVVPGGGLVGMDSKALGVGMSAVFGGGLLGGLGERHAPLAVLLLATACQLASAIGFLSIRHDLGGRSHRNDAAWVEVTRRVIHLVTTSPTRFVVIVTASLRALLGGSFATFVTLAGNGRSGTDGYLLAVAVTGTGSFAGACLASRAHQRLGAATVVAGAYVVPALALGTAGVVGRRVVLECALFGSFLAFQLVRVVADATVQANIDDESRGRVFAIYDVGYNVAYFAGAATAIAFGAAERPDHWFLGLGLTAGVLLITLATVRRSLHPEHRPGRRPTAGSSGPTRSWSPTDVPSGTPADRLGHSPIESLARSSPA